MTPKATYCELKMTCPMPEFSNQKQPLEYGPLAIQMKQPRRKHRRGRAIHPFRGLNPLSLH